MNQAFVVTGGGRGVGRAIAERLLNGQNAVVIIESDASALAWLETHSERTRLIAVAGDAGDNAVAEHAADLAQKAGTLKGWVNNAAIFQDASLHEDGSRRVLELISGNLSLAVTGAGVAVRRFLEQGEGGAIVNVSSHQGLLGITR